MIRQKITIIGAGVAGLWCGFLLSKNGFDVSIYEQDNISLENSCSYRAGGMLAPYCEGECSGEHITILGVKSLELWQEYFPNFVHLNGSLSLAHKKDLNQLDYFAGVTKCYKWLNNSLEINSYEPDIAPFFNKGLFYEKEGHLEPRILLRELIARCNEQNVKFHFEQKISDNIDGIVIDTRGLAAKNDLDNLRAVKGEMLVIKSLDVNLNRPVRLLHNKYPLYIVPRENNIYMIGATTIETYSDNNFMSVRSAGELLTQAYNLHPAFAEAQILEMNVGFRPAFSDNMPKLFFDNQLNRFVINGLYRHGWLMAPIMAKQLLDILLK